MEFNKVYNSDFFKKDKINKFNIGDEVDIPIDNKESKFFLDKKICRSEILCYITIQKFYQNIRKGY